MLACHQLQGIGADVTSADTSKHLQTGAQAAEVIPDSFIQHPRYVEMCVRVMEAALQQGLESSLPAWSQTALQNIRNNCKLPPVEPAR